MQPENRFSPSNDDLGSLIGKTLGQFRIVDRIGAGGMATVFKAYQPTLDRYVAIKVLPAFYAHDPVFVQRFVQEARSVAKLAHPRIVQIHDFGEENHITYIVMEYVDGGTLKDRLKRALLVPEAVDYMIQAAEGLDCAHRNGIIHRDVKPANMLLRKDNHLLLSDFGIAKILEGTANLTRVGTGIGTPQYMSPEQGMGQPVDRRSDIYSLGIVLFHCFTGRVPFTADSPLTITVKHMNDPLPVERLVAEGVPSPMIQVVQKMTEKSPEMRYQSADVVVDALTSALVASGFSLQRSYHGGGGVQAAQPMSSSPAYAPGSVICFRCGAANPGSRLFCTTCGDDLANKRASQDKYLVNGRVVLSLLTMQTGPMKGRSYRFHQDATTVGRTNGNDLVISGSTVSRRHARLWFYEGQWYIEDVGSVNGTFVNNNRLFQQTVLKDGDTINFGDEKVIFNVTYRS